MRAGTCFVANHPILPWRQRPRGLASKQMRAYPPTTCFSRWAALRWGTRISHAIPSTDFAQTKPFWRRSPPASAPILAPQSLCRESLRLSCEKSNCARPGVAFAGALACFASYLRGVGEDVDKATPSAGVSSTRNPDSNTDRCMSMMLWCSQPKPRSRRSCSVSLKMPSEMCPAYLLSRSNHSGNSTSNHLSTLLKQHSIA